MITEERIEEIVKDILELHTGKVAVSLNHFLKKDLLIPEKDLEDIIRDMEEAFLERENCDIEIYSEIGWFKVEDICISVANGLIEEGYSVIKKQEIEEM